MHFVSMRYSKAVVLVKDYSLDVNILLSIFANLLRKRFRKGYWQMIERRHRMLWKAECRVPQQPKDVQRPGNVKPHC